MRGIRPTEECSICAESPDNIEHYLFYCTPVRAIWADLESKIHESDETFYLSCLDTILGNPAYSIPLNIVLLWTRVYIYHCKMNEKDITFAGLIAALKDRYRILFSLAKRQSSIGSFTAMWNSLSQIFNIN